jgi:hypothetical protein
VKNYIAEINQFYDWLETNQITKSSIALWHALMHIHNKSGSPTAFTVAISTIESKTGFKQAELYKARNILTQKGRIKWQQRGGSLCAEYKIIPFCLHTIETKSITNGITNSATNGNTKESIILNKSNSIILKEKKEKETVAPTIEEVVAYFKEKGYTEHTARTAFDYYQSANWYDSRGNKVANWRQKMISVWFKPENKIANQPMEVRLKTPQEILAEREKNKQ